MIIIFVREELNGEGRMLMDSGELAKLDPAKHVRGPHYIYFGDSNPVVIFVAPDKQFVVAKSGDIGERPVAGLFVERPVSWGLMGHRLARLVEEEERMR